MRPKKIWGMQAHTIQGNLKEVLMYASRIARQDDCTYEIWCNSVSSKRPFKHLRTVVVGADGYCVEWYVNRDNSFKLRRFNKLH